MRKMKRTIGLIMISLMLLSNFAVPMKADASETTMPETIDYDDTYPIATYWEDKVAPTKPGYVFGGWFTKNGTEYLPIKEAEIVAQGVEKFKGAYAKFVPAYVLSVRAQLQKATEDDETRGDSTFLRVISAVDSTQYKNVGFDVLFNKKTPFAEEQDKKTVITTVYEELANDDEGTIKATEEFGAPATHFSVLKINSIKAKNYSKVIYVTPYWTTMDGTKVEGISKYVRVIDGYTSNKYISVPVNLLTGDPVAAGKIQMKYDYETLNYVGYDTGVLLPNMEINVDTSTGVITFIGNASVGENNTYTDVDPTSGIYANVWFQKKSDTEIAGASVPERWEFLMSNLSFCNWSEAMITNVEAWNTRY